jgi:hypothetical protein
MTYDNTDSDADSVIDADVNNESVNADEGEITNETKIVATRGTDSASQTADNRVNPFDSETKDNRGEFSAGEFTPDKSGIYKISFQIRLEGNTTEGDLLQSDLRDSADNLVNGHTIRRDRAEGPTAFFDESYEVELTAGETYKLQVENKDSSYVVTSATTRGTITRSVVQ